MARLSKKSSSPSNREYFNSQEAKKQLDKASDYRRYARNIVDLVPMGSGKLLDVGCGMGWIVREAKNRGFQAKGIDPAPPYVHLGKKNLKVNLQVASLESFQTKEKFDAIVLNHVLEHIKDLNFFLYKVRSLLNRNGIILVACPNAASLMHYVFKDRWYGLVPSQHYWQFTSKSLPNIIAQNGFKTEKVIVNNLDYQVPGVKGYLFKILLALADLTRTGDQVIVAARKA